MFSMFLSFLFWIAMVQLCRYVQRSIALRAISATNNGTAPPRRETMQFLAHMMQAGRTGPASAMLSNRLRMALLERDFTGDDYEMLQGLDEESSTSPHPRRGAEQVQIDRLPLHTVTPREVADNATLPGGAPTCNICLGPYEANEEVRTVPCMHQFHKHCIDTWLRDRAVCPVCKHRAVAP